MDVDLRVNVEIKGHQTLVGYLRGNDYKDTCFSYDKNYIDNVGRPISISLPLQLEKFSQ